MTKPTVVCKGNYAVSPAPGFDSVAIFAYKDNYKATHLEEVVVKSEYKQVVARFPVEVEKGEITVTFLPLEKKDEKIPGTKGYPTKASEYADRGTTPYSYPIDKKHIHAAVSYFGGHGHKFGDPKKVVAERILRAAKKYGVHVGKDSDVYKAAHGS